MNVRQFDEKINKFIIHVHSKCRYRYIKKEDFAWNLINVKDVYSEKQLKDINIILTFITFEKIISKQSILYLL